jgi:methylated-DNA-[protein]-cysteine S-methyltransferase
MASTATVLQIARYDSPLGLISVAILRGKVCALEFEEDVTRTSARLARRFGAVSLEENRDPAGVIGAIREYFAGRGDAFDSLAVDAGGTPFQQRVWAALRRIPPGRTISYRDLATMAGVPAATRAVGGANGANPVPLIVPCHRVIAANGRLGGYGGGLDRKAWLLRHEGAGDGPLYRSAPAPVPSSALVS